jgi:hypothetical protein
MRHGLILSPLRRRSLGDLFKRAMAGGAAAEFFELIFEE